LARPKNHSKHVADAVEALVRSVGALVDSVADAVRTAAPAPGKAGARAVKAPGQRGPGRNNPRLKSALKSYWSKLTPAQRKKRVNAILIGRGLKPKK
jgi:hypothetical protein